MNRSQNLIDWELAKKWAHFFESENFAKSYFRNCRTFRSVQRKSVTSTRIRQSKTNPSVPHKSVDSTQSPDDFMWNWRICVILTDFRSWKAVALLWNWRFELMWLTDGCVELRRSPFKVKNPWKVKSVHVRKILKIEKYFENFAIFCATVVEKA